MLEQTWLSKPTAAFSSTGPADWSKHTSFLPSLRYGKNLVPKNLRVKFGDPPLDLPFVYSDPRIQEFFTSDSWLRNSKINLPDCFDSDTTYSTEQLAKLSLTEGLAKRSLQTAHGLFDLNSEFYEKLTLLSDMGVTNQSQSDWDTHLAMMKDFIFTNILALRRIVLSTSSSVMTTKQMAREIVLPRFVGKDALKSALLFSDFGTPDLFGPLDPKIVAFTDKYLTHDSKEWRLSARKRKSFPSAPFPAAKKVAKFPSLISPVTPAAPSASSSVTQKKPTPRHNFTGAKGKQGKRGGKGRGRRGS